MSRHIKYCDDERGTIDTYITNDDSDKIIELIRKMRRKYNDGEDDVKILKSPDKK